MCTQWLYHIVYHRIVLYEPDIVPDSYWNHTYHFDTCLRPPPLTEASFKPPQSEDVGSPSGLHRIRIRGLEFPYLSAWWQAPQNKKTLRSQTSAPLYRTPPRLDPEAEKHRERISLLDMMINRIRSPCRYKQVEADTCNTRMKWSTGLLRRYRKCCCPRLFFSSNLSSWTTLRCLISLNRIFSEIWAGLKGSTSDGGKRASLWLKIISYFLACGPSLDIGFLHIYSGISGSKRSKSQNQSVNDFFTVFRSKTETFPQAAEQNYFYYLKSDQTMWLKTWME